MLDIGIQELLVIMVLALLIFGPDKLPELGRRLGRAMREFRRSVPDPPAITFSLPTYRDYQAVQAALAGGT